jgi:hypothetical protein
MWVNIGILHAMPLSNAQSGLKGNDMRNVMPNFTYSSPKASDKYSACIEMNGQPFHKIKNLDVFYRELGYTPEIRKSGLLPDEFIWEQYINEYLTKNSIAFINEYGKQFLNWFENHVQSATDKNDLCVTCRHKSFCHIGMTSFEIPASFSTWLGGIANKD